MSKRLQLVSLLYLFCLVTILPGNAVYASDEDLSSSVYLVFDPETGEFVTVQDQNRANQNHEPQELTGAAGGASQSDGKSDRTPALSLAAASVIALALAAGAIAWVQTRRKKRTSS